jgi:hypothetical protein
MAMKMRTRKLIGTIASVLWIAFYALFVMALGGAFIVGRGGVVEFLFFAVAGVAWLPVAMAIIRWMSRPDPPEAS